MFDYKESKKRVEEILNNATEITKKDIPKDDSNFTYDNGIRSWIGSIFVDIIDSKKLIQGQKDIVVAKILRSFTSEIITLMNDSVNSRQIGVRGDCVYGVFSTPTKDDVYELMNIAAYINTLVKMLNKLFEKKGYPSIFVGIGVAIGEDLIIKAGKKGTGINDRIWIGKAVIDACVLADKAGRNFKKEIGFNEDAYINFIDKLIEQKPDAKTWFTNYYENGKTEYYADLINSEFDEWVNTL